MSESERKRDEPKVPEQAREKDHRHEREGSRPGKAETAGPAGFEPARELLREPRGPFRDDGYSHKGVKVFPPLPADGSKAWFHENGWACRSGERSVTTEIKVGDPAERRGFKKHLCSARESVPQGYQAAHAVGAGMGVESPHGIALATEKVNQELQNREIERQIRDPPAEAAGRGPVPADRDHHVGPRLGLGAGHLRTVRPEGRRPRALHMPGTIECSGPLGNRRTEATVDFHAAARIAAILRPAPDKPKT